MRPEFLGKHDKAPLWIPRKDADYIVVTCPECLRSSSLPDSDATEELQETDCIACGAKIRYLVDSSILKLLDEKKKYCLQFNLVITSSWQSCLDHFSL